MDCDDVNWGCDGGWMYDAYTVTAEHGVTEWNDYPTGYVGYKQRTCKDSHRSHENGRFYNTNGYEEDFVENDRIREIVSR